MARLLNGLESLASAQNPGDITVNRQSFVSGYHTSERRQVKATKVDETAQWRVPPLARSATSSRHIALTGYEQDDRRLARVPSSLHNTDDYSGLRLV
ncbi:MAG TPA: hypothetical protein VH592_22075 [Gemmataceae bacterium]|jgi:hypothetical protein